jgi:serine protease
MRRLLPTLALPLLLAALGAGAAPAPAQTAVAPARAFSPHQVLVKFAGERFGRALALPAGAGVDRAAAALRANPRVEYAEPNYVATASALGAGEELPLPNDPGKLRTGAAEAAAVARDWSSKQWNFLSPDEPAATGLPVSLGGIDAVGAWRNLAEAGRPGAEGVTIAVLDTGIAYRSARLHGNRYLRSPDFTAGQFVPGWDFVGHDRLPLDQNGHGTHVAGTIAEKTNNGIGLTGLAYRAKLMPVRVLDRRGVGYADLVARGIRFAVANGADVVNLSLNFKCGAPVPMVDEALRQAYANGVVVVASAGNLISHQPSGKTNGEACVSEPATGPRVIAVGGTTEGGCLGSYSLASTAIDLLAPGGGEPQRGCPSILSRPIYQVTLRKKSGDRFGIPNFYTGTSMAAAHVSGVAAMVLASGFPKPGLKPKGLVDTVSRHLRATARDLGLPRTQQGAGLVNAAAATAREP